MTVRERQRLGDFLAIAAGGFVLFALGLAILYLNPYWRVEPGSVGNLHHRVYAWRGIGHLVAALGLLQVFGCTLVALTLLVAQWFRSKWLCWAGAVCIIEAWLGFGYVSHGYNAAFHWDSHAGITTFRVLVPPKRWDDPVWQTLVRWQIEPDLDGYLRSGNNLRCTDGEAGITVITIVPIAVPDGPGNDSEELYNTEWTRNARPESH